MEGVKKDLNQQNRLHGKDSKPWIPNTKYKYSTIHSVSFSVFTKYSRAISRVSRLKHHRRFREHLCPHYQGYQDYHGPGDGDRWSLQRRWFLTNWHVLNWNPWVVLTDTSRRPAYSKTFRKLNAEGRNKLQLKTPSYISDSLFNITIWEFSPVRYCIHTNHFDFQNRLRTLWQNDRNYKQVRF